MLCLSGGIMGVLSSDPGSTASCREPCWGPTSEMTSGGGGTLGLISGAHRCLSWGRPAGSVASMAFSLPHR